jgi:glycerol-3-phosphate dehydrogenase
VDDARLVALNAVDAAERGATVRTRTRVTRAEREDTWRLILNVHGRRDVVNARVLVNAAGPWVGIVAETVLRVAGPQPLRLAKGSHIVVRKLFDHDSAYIFQNPDQRIVFALPFAGDFTLIGTTDESFAGNLDTIAPSAEEVLYLCRSVSEFFRARVEPDHVVWAFAGVRSLYDDGAGHVESVTREYRLELDERRGVAPLLTVYGGKITTYRKLAEDALAKLRHFFQMHGPWTARMPLPGGDFRWNAVEGQFVQTRKAWPFLTEPEVARLVRAYGTRVGKIMGDAKKRDDIGPFFGPLSAAEARYLMQHEWARTADDVLWRRSKLGLITSTADKEALAQFMAANQPKV